MSKGCKSKTTKFRLQVDNAYGLIELTSHDSLIKFTTPDGSGIKFDKALSTLKDKTNVELIIHEPEPEMEEI